MTELCDREQHVRDADKSAASSFIHSAILTCTAQELLTTPRERERERPSRVSSSTVSVTCGSSQEKKGPLRLRRFHPPLATLVAPRACPVAAGGAPLFSWRPGEVTNSLSDTVSEVSRSAVLCSQEFFFFFSFETYMLSSLKSQDPSL